MKICSACVPSGNDCSTCAVRPGVSARGDLFGNAGFFPALLDDRRLDAEAPADAARDDVVEHARVGRLGVAAARDPQLRRAIRVFYDAVQMHRVGHRAEEARRRAFDIRERRRIERIADRVGFVAPAGNAAFGGERADHRAERCAAHYRRYRTQARASARRAASSMSNTSGQRASNGTSLARIQPTCSAVDPERHDAQRRRSGARR